MTLKLYSMDFNSAGQRVRTALHLKGLDFEYISIKKLGWDEYRKINPQGLAPTLDVDGKRFAQSTAILEFIEEQWPEPPLLPKDPLVRARVRELVTHMELHVELVAHRTYGAVFFSGKALSDETREQVQRDLAKGIRTLQRPVKFDPFLAGRDLTLADCAAFMHLPIVSLATKLAFGGDALQAMTGLKPYLRMLGERPAFARVNADRKAAQEAARARGRA